jgi:Lipase (class 3)
MKSPDTSRYIMMSRLSNLAYEESKEAVVEQLKSLAALHTQNFILTEVLTDENSHLGFIADSGREIFISIRGTCSVQDWFYNLLAVQTAEETHLGFKAYSEPIWQQVIEVLSRSEFQDHNIYVLGHSLGGAAATLIGDRIVLSIPSARQRVEVYTFGAPPVGTEHFQLEAPIYRFCNAGDPVPHLPWISAQMIHILKSLLGWIPIATDFFSQSQETLLAYTHIGSEYQIGEDLLIRQIGSANIVDYLQQSQLAKNLLDVETLRKALGNLSFSSDTFKQLLWGLFETVLHEHDINEYIRRLANASFSVTNFSFNQVNIMNNKTVSVGFQIPDVIIDGLAKGIYERSGGVIREKDTKNAIAFIRNVMNANSIEGNAQTADAITNTLSFADGKNVSFNLTSMSSMLNLGISSMGFALVIQRLNELEERLKQAEVILKKIDRKIDIGYCANFRAALILADNALAMKDSENRKQMAFQAIDRFLAAQHIYTSYLDEELKLGSQISDEYLLILTLCYIAEARCYLEIGEEETAIQRFQKGVAELRPRFKTYISTLLTNNPAVYLQPQFKDQIDLRRLTRIYQWFEDSTIDEATLLSGAENFSEY